MDDETPNAPDAEASKKTELREEPEDRDVSEREPDEKSDRENGVENDPEMAIETAGREEPDPGNDPGSIEFQVESVEIGDDTAVSESAGHVIRVDSPAEPEPEARPEPEPVPGETRYELHDEIGAGGMAVVNAAHDRQLKRTVAVKRLRKELASSPRSRDRFFDEALVIAGLDHPGVVPVFEMGTLPGGDLYYSMKKVSGQTLETLISRRVPDEIDRREGIAKFIDIFERICQTMAAAHQAGIVHRDLKPSNIMVDELGSVLVMDWGLAKRIVDEDSSDSKKTVAGALLGTPSYMSPEQARGEAHRSDCRSDVFSLGVILYEILTGTNPFDRDSVKASLDVVVHLDPEPPRKVTPAADRDLEAICMKAIAKDPVNRYISARELADDIRRYREFRRVSARSPNLADRLGRWWRRNPRIGGAAAAFLAAILIVGVGLGFQASMERAAVAKGYQRIDAAERELDRITGEEDALESRLIADDLSVEERAAVEHELHELRVLRSFYSDLEESMALAITGFTVFSPDERAQSILRGHRLARIDEFLKNGEWFAAKVEIENLLRGAADQNLMGLSSDDVAMLGEKLGDAKRGLEEAEKEASNPRVVEPEQAGETQ